MIFLKFLNRLWLFYNSIAGLLLYLPTAATFSPDMASVDYKTFYHKIIFLSCLQRDLKKATNLTFLNILGHLATPQFIGLVSDS